MNEKEDYFRISKKEGIHTLSDRIPLRWKEVVAIPTSTFVITVLIFGHWLIGLVIGLLTAIGYMVYRFGAWIYYTEIQINEKSGAIVRYVKILNQINRVEEITDKFDPQRFEYTEIDRSGHKKYLLTYKTYKNHDLLILKNMVDKNQVQRYIEKEIRFEKSEPSVENDFLS